MGSSYNYFLFIDIDGVLADSTARFTAADSTGLPKSGPGSDEYWKFVFDPQLVIKDKPIADTAKIMNALAKDHYVVYLTSRPEALRATTIEWLYLNRYPTPLTLIHKPPVAQFTKTAVWKASVVTALSQLAWLTVEVRGFAYIDDEPENLKIAQDALMSLTMTNWTFGFEFLSSLKDLVTYLAGK